MGGDITEDDLFRRFGPNGSDSSDQISWSSPEHNNMSSNLVPALYDEDTNSTRDFDANIIFYKHPEDMLDPTKRNPIFYQIVITHAVTFVVGILGNLVAVFVMIGDRKSRNATNLFLVSLAVADLLLLLLCVPLEILQYFLQFDNNGFICKMAKYVLLLSASASVLNLCAVSLERFIVIVFPMRSRSLCTLSNCRKAILFVWVVATVLSLPVILTKEGYMVTYTNNVTSVKVYYCEEADEDTVLPFAIYQFVILFAAPGLLMMVCYIYVIRELWRSTRNINLLTNSRSFRGNEQRTKNERNNANSGGQDNKAKNSKCAKEKGNEGKSDAEKQVKKSETGTSHTKARRSVNQYRGNRGEDVKKARKQVIKMLILVIILFLICWGPKLILAIALKLATELFTPSVYNTRVIFNLIPFIHSCFNPVIYSFMSKNFRRSMRRQLARLSAIFGCNCVNNNPPSNSIPLRSTTNRTRKPPVQPGTSCTGLTGNYCSISEGVPTKHTEIHAIPIPNMKKE